MNPASSGETASTVNGERLAIVPYLGDKYLRVTGTLGGATFEILFSNFQPGNSYRAELLDDHSGLIHVYSGGSGPDDRLVLTSPLHSRIAIAPSRDGTLEWIDDSSPDQGTTWTTNTVYRMSRAADAPRP